MTDKNYAALDALMSILGHKRESPTDEEIENERNDKKKKNEREKNERDR